MRKNKKTSMSSLEKKIQYVLLILLLVLSFFAARYVVLKKERESLLLESGTKEVVCKVVGTWHTRLSGNIFEYSVLGKVYKKHNQNYTKFRTGEFFKGRYSLQDPNVVEIDLTAPVIINKAMYIAVTASITFVDIKSNPNRVQFIFSINGEEYYRTVYVVDASVYKIGDSCAVLVNKEYPEISYLKNNVNIR